MRRARSTRNIWVRLQSCSKARRSCRSIRSTAMCTHRISAFRLAIARQRGEARAGAVVSGRVTTKMVGGSGCFARGTSKKGSAIGAPLNQSGYWFLPIGRHGPIVIAAGLIVPIISGVSLGFRIARCIFELILAHIEAISAKLRVVIELVPWQTM